jgi:hypothetical protein
MHLFLKHSCQHLPHGHIPILIHAFPIVPSQSPEVVISFPFIPFVLSSYLRPYPYPHSVAGVALIIPHIILPPIILLATRRRFVLTLTRQHTIYTIPRTRISSTVHIRRWIIVVAGTISISIKRSRIITRIIRRSLPEVFARRVISLTLPPTLMLRLIAIPLAAILRPILIADEARSCARAPGEEEIHSA